MKKFAALTVGLAMMLSFASCGDKNKSESKKGSDKAASDYADNIYRKHGGKTIAPLILTDEYIKRLKSSDDWDDEIEYFDDMIYDTLEDYKVNVKSVKKGSSIDDMLDNAEKYLEDRFKDDIKVTKGYEYKIKFEMTDRDSGEKETITEKICVVKVGSDWKIIPAEKDFLESYD